MAVACDDLKPAITQQERMVIAEVYNTDDEKNALIRELDLVVQSSTAVEPWTTTHLQPKPNV